MTLPSGFSLAGVHAGIKRNPTREDVSLIVADTDCTAAGVYTQNRVVAAPVILDRERTPSESIRAVVINSGNANACTGEQGRHDALEMTRLAAAACGVRPEQVLVLSTGIIGEPLPMEAIARGISRAADALGQDESSLITAARGLMTTDTTHKIATRELQIQGQTIRITGLAKGAAMIGPNMATMLAVILTDAKLGSADAQRILSESVDESFNCISVEGHMSTNDTVLLLSSNRSNVSDLNHDELLTFANAVRDTCVQLAKAIPYDGEGATHLIEVEVTGCRSRQEAHRLASTIANSPLVKTAITGADPNWGRIVSAAGYANVEFDPADVELTLNGILLFQCGSPVPFDEQQASESIRQNRDTQICFRLKQGNSAIRFWTCDLTAEYVHLNADYHT